MEQDNTTGDFPPRQIFFQTLHRNLLTPGVIFNALGRVPTDHIFLAVAGIAFGKWIEKNSLSETSHNVKVFFHALERYKLHAYRIIQCQARLVSRCESLH